MANLRLDYQHSRAFPWGGGILLTMSLSGLLMTAAFYRELHTKADDWEAKLEQGKPRQQDRGLVTRPAEDVVQEVKHANEVLHQLGLPWESLFRAVESSGSKDVVLLALEPDMEKRVMKISGEAKNIPAMLGYVTQLGEQDMFASVYLQSHQIQLQSQDKPVRFALLAVLKGQP
ncbi:hypothetical protein FGKAn22_13900 [Ferrigenium kumadai]|uniref:Transmembrane protein n=1 Tax=Ferrigenium kumadai TaxID=1682490 RepID=A0AAN1SZK4_9PROT|nr:hypothetical protein [Ferrigenium kumadai]BBI99697.1 hypothetical protein FGKAn22_13900 [Ferrigenium kumadai]